MFGLIYDNLCGHFLTKKLVKIFGWTLDYNVVVELNIQLQLKLTFIACQIGYSIAWIKKKILIGMTEFLEKVEFGLK